ncbi:hypothetical protein E6H18_05010 [Candidatus Bathyarchaeota archaeon]|nr:MAG: hypothetical protein AUF62_00200 [archaeon 13_1_20CM_52_20]TMI49236.1 MAG: hypothetical protein E6H20_08395 [Candidatus Bathyarchaeota archaeon]TMI57388.1 MAG: hypothetical protein E6H18_05010 [Candidatus Bathyarchaeota archaeon]
MSRPKGAPLLGPVGFLFAAVGFTMAVFVARLFVAVEARCTQSCPVIRVQGFHIHHLYYGVILLLASSTIMVFATDVRTRWDSALVVGVGAGLIADEVGLLIFLVPYWAVISLATIGLVGLTLYLATVYKLWTVGRRDFGLLDRYQTLSIFAVVLAMLGFLYFGRPLRAMYVNAALVAWVSASILLLTFGRKHIQEIRSTPLNPVPPSP